ncbi:MAG: PIN domain-containing protein [Patescibacteria group bacterium]
MTKKTLVVDASVLLAHFVPHENHHDLARQFFERVKHQKLTLILPVITFCETLQVYFRIFQNRNAGDRLFQEMIDWNIQKNLRLINLEAGFLTYFAAHHTLFALKTSDSILAITAHRFKCPLISWDKQLVQNAAKHVRAITPEEFLKKK